MASPYETTEGRAEPVRSVGSAPAGGEPTRNGGPSSNPERAPGHGGHATPTRWHRRVEQLNFETSEAAAAEFATGAKAGGRQFVWEPLCAFVRAWRQPAESPPSFGAVLAGYAAIVRAAKLWEAEMAWRDAHLESVRRGRISGLVRRGWRDRVERVLSAPDEGEPVAGGRGATRRIPTERGTIVARRFRRGGAVRWLGETYFGFRPRPLREFDLLLRARRRGLPVPEPIAAVVERRRGIAYRGHLLTGEVVGGRPLLEALRGAPREDLIPRLALAVRSLHDAGLDHPDLNVGNVLAVPGLEGSRVVFVDLDRARLGGKPLGAARRRRGLARLRRSAAKVDPEGRWLSPRELDRMEALYWGHGEPA